MFAMKNVSHHIIAMMRLHDCKTYVLSSFTFSSPIAKFYESPKHFIYQGSLDRRSRSKIFIRKMKSIITRVNTILQILQGLSRFKIFKKKIFGKLVSDFPYVRFNILPMSRKGEKKVLGFFQNLFFIY